MNQSLPGHNLVVYGITAPETGDVVRRLSADESVRLVAWFGRMGSPGVTHSTNGVYDYDYKTGAVSDALYAFVFQHIYTFMDMYSRSNRDADGLHIRHRDFHEYVHVFNRHVYFFAELLIQNKVDVVLLGNNPHLGGDLILYQIARFLGIRTLLCHQSPLFANKFMLLDELGGYDVYRRLPADKLPRERVEVKKREVPVYMKGPIKTSRYGTSELGQSLSKNAGAALVKGDIKGLMRKSVYVMKYLDHREFQKNMARLTLKSVDWNKPFVYFPLHLQPEMTTASLGGPFTDQALAIERVARMIPDDWMIYIKENPKQSEYKRDPGFYQRIEKIPNARFVPIETNTFELGEKCQFLATISGTAGWEALTFEKPALIFGRSWYEDLPGIFRYSDALTLETITACRVALLEVEEALNQLLAKMEDGVIDAYYTRLVPDFDVESNAKMVSKALLARLMSHKPAGIA